MPLDIPDSQVYDPEACGAKCSKCVLRGSTVVPPELNPGAKVLLVGDMPGVSEIQQGRPFVGGSGMELESALTNINVPRSRVALTNAVLCRPENNDMRRASRQLKQENERRKLKGQPLLEDPAKCCRPRLIREVRCYRYVVGMGTAAHQSLTGLREKIGSARGSMQTLQFDGTTPHKIKYLPTVHPSLVLRQRRFQWPFRSDFAKAWRYFAGKTKWSTGHQIWWPKPAVLRKLLLDPNGAVLRFENPDGGTEKVRCKLPRFTKGQFRGKRRGTYDFETMHKLSALDSQVRCVGVGCESWMALIPVASIAETRRVAWARATGQLDEQPLEGSPWYTPAECAEILEIWDAFCTDRSVIKTGWNSGAYDRTVNEQWRGITPSPAVDGILCARTFLSELPRRLGFVGLLLTDAEDWKGDHLSTRTDDDNELHPYCMSDVQVTDVLMPKVMEGMRQANQAHLLGKAHRIQKMCVAMHRNGLWVNEERRERTERWLFAEGDRTEAVCQRIAADYGSWKGGVHNPRSVQQLSDLLFERWGFQPSKYTETGDPSTDENSVLTLRRDRRLTDDQKEYLDNLLKHRGARKLSGTYLVTCRNEQVYWRAKDRTPRTFAEAYGIRGQGDLRHGRVSASDLRLHASYLAHGPVTWRLSSSNPNVQNWVKVLRYMVQAMPQELLLQQWKSGDLHRIWGKYLGWRKGAPPPAWCYTKRTFVGADKGQLELRVSAALSDCDAYLQVFKDGGDPHAITAKLLFGAKFETELKHYKRTGKKTAAFTMMRNTAKVFVYLVTYGGSAETAWKGMTDFLDWKGGRPYADLPLKVVDAFRKQWLKGAPEYEKWWVKTVAEYQRQGYLEEPVWGVRRFFLDGKDFNELVNFKVQAAGNSVVQISTQAFLERYPFEWCWENWGPGTGLVTQTHDANLVECPAEVAAQVGRDLEECMTRRVPGLDVPFIGEHDITDNWAQAC